jgi:hypothetical protein
MGEWDKADTLPDHLRQANPIGILSVVGRDGCVTADGDRAGVGLLESLYIPPPPRIAELTLKVMFVKVGLLAWLYIPPPRLAGDEPLALPAVMVKPSRVAPVAPMTTW